MTRQRSLVMPLQLTRKVELLITGTAQKVQFIQSFAKSDRRSIQLQNYAFRVLQTNTAGQNHRLGRLIWV